jgi:hypothetical protein
MLKAASGIERRFALPVFPRRIGARFDDCLDQLDIAGEDRKMERREPSAIDGIDVRAIPREQLDDFGLLAGDRGMKRGVGDHVV